MATARNVPIVLSEYQREQLVRWVATPGTPARLVRRSRIVLQLASGSSVHRASEALAISEPTVRLWRDRFRTGGIDALTTDAPRPGRPRRARDEARAAVTARLNGPAGPPLSVRALARDTGLGRHLVQQVLLELGIAIPTGRPRPAAPRSDSEPQS